MQEIMAYTHDGEPITSLVQWDSDVYVYLQKPEVHTVLNLKEQDQFGVHFYNSEMDKSLVVEHKIDGSRIIAKIPNVLLTTPYTIVGYITAKDIDEEKRCKSRFRINIIRRPMPSSLIFKDTKDYLDAVEILKECREHEENAKKSEENAKKSEDNAKVSETNAKNSENAAKDYATASANSATASQNSATASADSATAANTSANKAKTSEDNAKASETAAASSAQSASSSATSASNSATAASRSASAASTSEQHAKTSEDNAKTSETAASGSATSAASSATSASNSASAANTSATNASQSADDAADSASAAANSASAAASSATNAKTSEDNARNSANAAATSASAASTSATNSANSASAASTSATNAANSASAAAGSATTATSKATEAFNYATEARSYARGDTSSRSGEATDNAKYYYEQCKKLADLFSASGSGGVRYKDGKLQYYDDSTSSWVDIPISTGSSGGTGGDGGGGGEPDIDISEDVKLYGFKIDWNESDPASMITYPSNVDNANYTPAHMDYETDTFDYGDWTVKNGAWFMDVKPCLLNRDGKVEKFLNVDDLTKDTSGNDVSDDIQGTNNAYNVMNQNPKTYWYVHDNGDNTANIYFSNKKLNYNKDTGKITEATSNKADGDFVCWSNIAYDGSEIPYFYTPVYDGCYSNGFVRSLSNKSPYNSGLAKTEINRAIANNPDDSTCIWFTEVFSDIQLISMLLLLIGKSTDTQKVFGDGYNYTSMSAAETGTLNSKGLFYGSSGIVHSGVKVFGMEHFWGNQWRRIAGWINDKGTQKVKMTYGTSDGSTADGYNTTGSGYISIPNSTPSATTTLGYISNVLFTEYGIIPTEATGSATTYIPDAFGYNNNKVGYSYFGGQTGTMRGAFAFTLSNEASFGTGGFGVSISCKPKS